MIPTGTDLMGSLMQVQHEGKKNTMKEFTKSQQNVEEGS